MENQSKKNWHDRHYKALLIIPAILILFSLIYIGIFYSNNGDFFHKDVSLTGGTVITLTEEVNLEELEQSLSGELENFRIRKISDVVTGEQTAVVIQTTTSGEEAREILESYLGYELNSENSSFEFTGSTLSESFSKQLIIAIIVAFLFMAIVVFILFKNFVPSAAVILSAFADILMTLVFVNILGIKMSSAGIVALLMLIGYSVDTDILLTTRILKRHEGSLNKRFSDAFKTGMTMTLTSLFAIGFALLIVKSFSEVLTQVFTILVIGLGFDILNTWIMNASIIKWYAIKKKKN